MPERWLEMGLYAADAKEETLPALGADPAQIDTELMRVGLGRWRYDPPEPPKVYGAQ